MRLVDLVGQTFGDWTVKNLAPSKKGQTLWECQCVCGNIKAINSYALRQGKSTSCGCRRGPAHNFLDLAGLEYGLLTVVKHLPERSKTNKTLWLCVCLCGAETTCSTGALRSGSVKTCGSSSHRQGTLNPGWKGCGDISKSFWNRVIWHASSKNRELLISIEDAWDLFLAQDKKCALSGVPLNFSSKVTSTDGTASLDRVDSAKGYIPGNVQWVHKYINALKSDFPQELFINLCRTVTHFQETKESVE